MPSKKLDKLPLSESELGGWVPPRVIQTINNIIDLLNGSAVEMQSVDIKREAGFIEPTFPVQIDPPGREFLGNSEIEINSIPLSELYKFRGAVVHLDDELRQNPEAMALYYGVAWEIGVKHSFNMPVRCTRKIGSRGGRVCGFPYQSLEDRMLKPVGHCEGCIDGSKNG